MSAINIVINMDNEAFHETGNNVEVCRILRELADRLDPAYHLAPSGKGELLPLRDVNGNTVGRVFIT